MSDKLKDIKIEIVPIDSIKPYDKNPRINGDAVDAVAESIKTFGFNNPILVGKKSVIIAGHTRLKAAKQLELKEVPIVRLEHLTEAQFIAFNIADNQTASIAEWDIPALGDLISELKTEDSELLSSIGFDEERLAEILADAESYSDNFNLPSGDKPGFEQMTFTISTSQAEIVRVAMKKAKDSGEFKTDNENSNGNAITRICEAYNGDQR